MKHDSCPVARTRATAARSSRAAIFFATRRVAAAGALIALGVAPGVRGRRADRIHLRARRRTRGQGVSRFPPPTARRSTRPTRRSSRGGRARCTSYSLACPHQNTALKWSDRRQAVRVPEAPLALHARRHLHQGQRARDARARPDGRAQGRQQRRRESRQAVSGRRGRSRVEDRVRHRLTANRLFLLDYRCPVRTASTVATFSRNPRSPPRRSSSLEGCGDGQIGPIRRRARQRRHGQRSRDFPGLATVGHGRRHHRRTRARSHERDDVPRPSRAICTHQGCDTDVRNNRFECPCHGSIFSQRRLGRARTGHREPADHAARRSSPRRSTRRRTR